MTTDHILVRPVRANYNSNVVCVYSRGPRVTHYLGLDGTELVTKQLSNDEFEREFDRPLLYTPVDFAKRYIGSEVAQRMIPISGRATRVLASILRGQPAEAVIPETLAHLEKHMSEQTGFRKPDGPVAQIHAFLDKKADAIKAGKISRKELIDQLEAKEFNRSTVVTQCGHWAKTNGVAFARPTQAAATKKEAAAKARAAKKKVTN